MGRLLLKYLCCLLLTIIYPLIAQNTLEVHLDYARFRGDENMTFVEVYYSVNRSALSHIYEDGEYQAKYNVQLKVAFNDSTIKSVDRRGVDKVAAIEEIGQQQSINDVHQFLLAEGTFRILLTITDLNNRKSGSKSVQVHIPAMETRPIYMSDLQLALNLNSTSEKSRFVKNGIEAVPNPSRIYNLNWPVLFYYSEIYKRADTLMSSDIYQIKEEILDAKGNLIKTLPVRQKEIGVSGVVNINKVPVSALHSGLYELKVEILGENNQLYDTKKTSFYVYRPADFLQTDAAPTSRHNELYVYYLTFSEEDLDAEFEKASYIATSQESSVYKTLELDGKRKFLTEFWIRQSDSVVRDARAARSEYLQRVNYANERFAQEADKGWKTDLGRVAILYGVPDDIEKYMGAGDTKPHEVWTYDAIENGVKFIYVDVSGYGSYRLVHSTMLNEIKDYNWQERYSK